MNFVTSISLVVLGAMFLALLGWGSIRAAWRNCEGRRGVFAALAILAAICSIVAQKPSPDTPTITVDALLRDVGCYATNNVFHVAVTNAPSYAGVDFSDCDLMVYARERASTNAASWFALTPRKKFSQQPADYAIENATNFNYMVYLNYVPPSPVHTNGVFELYGFVVQGDEPGNLEQLAAGFINSRAITIRDLPYDAEVEYLESTGTQWIDTGVVLNQSSAVEFGGRAIANVGFSFFGARVSYNSRGFAIARFSAGWLGSQYGSRQATQVLPVDDKWHVFRQIKEKFSIDEVHTYDYTYQTFDTPHSALLFCQWNGTAPAPLGQMQISYCKIWDANGVLVRDFIPVRVGTTGAIYDKRGVGGMNSDGSPRNDGMYFNRGTGNFGYGNDK